MHGAPSVSYPVGRSRLALAIIASVSLGGACAVAGWVVQARPGTLASAAAIALVLSAGAIAFGGWWRTPAGTLSWDGQSWTWNGSTGEVEALLDLQRALLLQFDAAGARTWLWLDRSGAPQRWEDLRRAVYSRARPQALPRA